MQKASQELIIFLLINIIIFTSVAALAMYFIFRHKKKIIRTNNNIARLKIENEKEVLKIKLEIQEQTAHNIAREIHDSVGHALTLAKLHLNTLPVIPESVQNSKIHQSIDLLTHSIHQLSDISKNLNADALLQQGLLHAVEEEIARIRLLGKFDIYFEVNGFMTYLSPKKEVIIFRIIQEGFQNILKHAEASRSQLLIHFHPASIQISVSDNGRGFDTSHPVQSRSTGLKNMESRIRFLKGKSEIHSEPGKGTRIQFTIPYMSDENQ